MSNDEIRKRIPVLEGLALQYESLLNTSDITEDRYHQLNQELIDEIDVLEEMATENNRREKFDEMMGNPLKILEGWFK